jgi:hypothetical protein
MFPRAHREHSDAMKVYPFPSEASGPPDHQLYSSDELNTFLKLIIKNILIVIA